MSRLGAVLLLRDRKKHAFGVEERSHVRLMDYLASSSLYSSIYRVRHYI